MPYTTPVDLVGAKLTLLVSRVLSAAGVYPVCHWCNLVIVGSVLSYHPFLKCHQQWFYCNWANWHGDLIMLSLSSLWCYSEFHHFMFFLWAEQLVACLHTHFLVFAGLSHIANPLLPNLAVSFSSVLWFTLQSPLVHQWFAIDVLFLHFFV